jgi:hypothetical protein
MNNRSLHNEIEKCKLQNKLSDKLKKELDKISINYITKIHSYIKNEERKILLIRLCKYTLYNNWNYDNGSLPKIHFRLVMSQALRDSSTNIWLDKERLEKIKKIRKII